MDGFNFIRKKALVSQRWLALFFAVTIVAAGLMQAGNVKPAFADTGGYTWADAACADSGSTLGETSGTGYWCSDYNWGESSCPSGDGYCGTEMNGYYLYDQWGEGFRNCTSYAAWELNQVFGINPNGWGNGAQWNTAALDAGYSDDSSPQVGDIAQWNATSQNPWGHVAYVYAVNAGVASYDEYNYAEDGNFLSSYTSASDSQGAPNNWIHFGPTTSTTHTDNTGGLTSMSVSPTDNHLHALAIASNGDIYGNVQLSSGWNGWSSLGSAGGGFTSSVVSSVSPTDDRVHALAVASNGDVYGNVLASGTGWNGWSSLGSAGGGFTGGLTETLSPTDNQVHALAVASNGDVYGDTLTYGSGWNGWSDLGSAGGGFTGGLFVILSPTDGQVHALAVASNGDIYGNVLDFGTGWNGWSSLGSEGGGFTGGFTGSVTMAISPADNQVHALAVTSGGTVYANVLASGSGWGSWNNLGSEGGGFTSGVSSAISPTKNEISALAPTSGGNMYRNNLGSSGWDGWSSLGSEGGGF